jgi:hypothetical protein
MVNLCLCWGNRRFGLLSLTGHPAEHADQQSSAHEAAAKRHDLISAPRDDARRWILVVERAERCIDDLRGSLAGCAAIGCVGADHIEELGAGGARGQRKYPQPGAARLVPQRFGKASCEEAPARWRLSDCVDDQDVYLDPAGDGGGHRAQ